jgi:hypothetical protein
MYFKKLPNFISPLLILFFCIGVYLRWELLNNILVNDWNIRDIDRAFSLFDGDYIPLAGPEINTGGRLPGPLMYFLLAIPLFIKRSYESIFIFNFFINIASLIGLLFILKKYFNKLISYLTVALLAIYLPYLGNVGFPINPSFIFPFTLLFLWGYFGFIFEENDKYIYLMVLGIALGVQFHFSITTLVIAPILLGFLFKIQIRFKTIIWSIVLTIICFFPYLIYEFNFFIPIDTGIPTFEKHNLISILGIPLLPQTIWGLIVKNGIWRYQHFDIEVAWIYLILTYLGLTYIGYLIIKKYRSKSLINCKKELIIFTLFYVPALIYEIILPFRTEHPHNWYSYIFIFPQFLIYSYFLTCIFKSFNSNKIRIISGIIGLVLITFLIKNSFNTVTIYQKTVVNNLFSKNFQLRRYKDFKEYSSFLKSFMDQLKLAPQQYFQRVYFEGLGINGGPQSLKLLQAIASPQEKHYLNIDAKKNKREKCFYIRSSFTGLKEALRNYYIFNDSNIDIDKSYPIIVFFGNKKNLFYVYEYMPKHSQSCYNNTFNNYVTEKKTRNLLYKNSFINPTSDNFKKNILVDAQYNSDGELESYKGEFLLYFKDLHYPLRFKMDIHFAQGNYYILGSIERYNFEFVKKIIGKMNLTIHSNLELEILPENSMATIYPPSNQYWYKNFIIPVKNKWHKNELKLNLSIYLENKMEQYTSLLGFSKKFPLYIKNKLPVKAQTILPRRIKSIPLATTIQLPLKNP